MMYGLERRVQASGNGRIRFALYVACGKRGLLERVRQGQEDPTEWRIVALRAGHAENKAKKLLKAG